MIPRAERIERRLLAAAVGAGLGVARAVRLRVRAAWRRAGGLPARIAGGTGRLAAAGRVTGFGRGGFGRGVAGLVAVLAFRSGSRLTDGVRLISAGRTLFDGSKFDGRSAGRVDGREGRELGREAGLDAGREAGRAAGRAAGRPPPPLKPRASRWATGSANRKQTSSSLSWRRELR